MPTDFSVLLYQAASPDASTSNRSLLVVHTLNIIYKWGGVGRCLESQGCESPAHGTVTMPVFTETGRISHNSEGESNRQSDHYKSC